MSELDLIPADYARRQAVRRRLRALAVLLCALGGVLIAGRLGLGVLLSAEKSQVARLQQKKLVWQQTKAKTEKFVADAASAQKQLLALDELRGRENLRQFLDALDEAYVDKVWFDEIRYFRQESLALARDPRAPKPAGETAPRLEQRVAMTGHSMSHATLADFMRRLERQPPIAELNLIDTSPRSQLQSLIIDFKLAVVLHQPAVQGKP